MSVSGQCGPDAAVSVPYARPCLLGNKDLSWEKTDKFNFGIETQFFNQRLTVDLDYYYEKTIDLINENFICINF